PEAEALAEARIGVAVPDWVREFELEEERLDLTKDPVAEIILLISQVNRHFHLGEPLRVTANRRWWDILTWRLAMEIERQYAEAEEVKQQTTPERVHDTLSPEGWT